MRRQDTGEAHQTINQGGKTQEVKGTRNTRRNYFKIKQELDTEGNRNTTKIPEHKKTRQDSDRIMTILS